MFNSRRRASNSWEDVHVPLFVVDEEKCIRGGICVETCPRWLIALENHAMVPVPTEDAEELCVNCGHCVAVCPTGAISLSTMKPEECPPVRKEWLLSPEQAEHFLRSRRSIRNYSDKAVDREVLSRLVQIACCAPSGHNSQPVQWLVIYESDEVQRLAGLTVDWMRNVINEQPALSASLHLDRIVAAWDAGKDRVCRNAPHMIVAHSPEDLPVARSACTIALTYLELAAPAFGLGTCWAGYFDVATNLWPPLKDTLKLPDGHTSFGAVMIGHPKYKYQRMPLRNQSKISWH